MARLETLDPDIIAAALAGLQQKMERLDEQIAAVRSLMGQRRRGRPRKTEAVAEQPEEHPKKRRTMSADAKKRIAEGQKTRWAAFRKEQKG